MKTTKTMPKDNRVAAGAWGEPKQRANIMLTATALEKIDTVADSINLTRSEVLERLVRTHCLDPQILLNIGGIQTS